MKKTNNAIFTQAAEKVLSTIETPSKLLLFITDALNWKRSESDKKECDTVYFLTTVIDNLVQPWFTGAENSSKEQTIDMLATGIFEVANCVGPDGLHDSLGCLLMAYGKDFQSYASYSVAGYRNDFAGMSVIQTICLAAKQWEDLDN